MLVDFGVWQDYVPTVFDNFQRQCDCGWKHYQLGIVGYCRQATFSFHHSLSEYFALQRESESFVYLFWTLDETWQEDYNRLRSLSYRGSDVFLLAFSHSVSVKLMVFMWINGLNLQQAYFNFVILQVQVLWQKQFCIY